MHQRNFKNLYILGLMVMGVWSCGPQTSGSVVKNEVRIDTTQHANTVFQSTQPLNSGNIDVDRLIGYWRNLNDENVTFIATKDSLTYPDLSKSYLYQLKGNDVYIFYDSIPERFAVRNKHDTLIFIGVDTQYFFRLKY